MLKPKDYDGELVWLFRHNSSEEDTKKGLPKIAVFGAYTTVVPKTNGHDSSDKDCYLFSLIPKFKCLYPMKYQNMACSNYMNSSDDFKKGIGFSRDDKSNRFRLWIDENFATGCYVSNNTYHSDVFQNETILEGIEKPRVFFLIIKKIG